MSKRQAADKNKTVETKTKDDVLDSIFEKMAGRYNIPSNEVPTILRETAFKQADGKNEASPAEMKSLLTVADKYDLNPFLREIYAFRNKKGVIVPIVGVDGWIKILNREKTFEGFELSYCENMITIGKSKPCYEWVEIIIHDSNRKYPVIIREYLDECYNGGKFEKAPWDTHTKRFLRWKVISQGARVAYNVNDVYDHDEAERIDQALESEIKRETELEKPETAEAVPVTSEPVQPAPAAEDLAPGEIPTPKVLNEIPKEQQAAPTTVEPTIKVEKKIIDEPTPEETTPEAVQENLIEPVTQEKEPEAQTIPDIF